MAAVDDSIREVEWRDLADTVLVFVCKDTPQGAYMLIRFQDGLFAAFLSAFLIFLVPQLQTSSTDVTMEVLIHISQQLSNSTTPAFEPTAFQVSPNVAAVNSLFFLSLALVLIDAFLAMLVKGWLHDFDRGWRKYTVAHLRAQERERRLHELERWKLHGLVALLPILIQGSLLLFCIGLLVLIFPLHLPSAILFSIAFASVAGFYLFTTCVSIVNNYAPFSSPMSRLLARGLAILHTWQLHIARRVASAIPFNNPPLPPQGKQVDTDASHKVMQPVPSNNGVAKPNNPDGVEKSKVVPRSRSAIDPQTHVNVLERLVSTTVEAVESVPIFLELLDQPVKDNTVRPSNVDKWKELLDITLGLLRDRPTSSVSAACTLARTMMICYNRETPDRQLCLTLQHLLGSRESGGQQTHIPLNDLFHSWLGLWLGHSASYDVWRAIAFLEPSDAADAELLWMVNTSHRTIRPEIRDGSGFQFFVAVLTYVSSTEQSRRSQVPLTAAVIYAMHTIRSAVDNGGINSIDGLCLLPGTVSTSESVPVTFCQVDHIDPLDLWSGDYIRLVQNLLQWAWAALREDELCLPLIAALYIDSTKKAQARERSTFANLLKYTRITDVPSQYSGAYDHGKLAVYLFMAVSQIPIDQHRYPTFALYDVIERAISEHSALQLSGLRILEIAVKHVQKTASPSSNWLTKLSYGLQVVAPDPSQEFRLPLVDVDPWVLLHLDTLLAPKTYLRLEEVKELKWSDTPEKEHIASARLALYDDLAKAERKGAKGPQPDPELLKVFLWSKNHSVCSRAFKWCLELVPISQLGIPRDADSTRMFIPETMGYEWIEHFVHVLCSGESAVNTLSWDFLKSHLVPKWAMLPPSWCCGFASAFLFSIVHPPGLPAYQFLAEAVGPTEVHELSKFLSFLSTMLEPIQSMLTSVRLTSLENWFANIPEAAENRDAHAQMEHILSTSKQKLTEETLGNGRFMDS